MNSNLNAYLVDSRSVPNRRSFAVRAAHAAPRRTPSARWTRRFRIATSTSM
jgi:hypothetical protein